MARKYTQIFFRVHYLFQDANNCPRAKLTENCGKDRGYFVYFPSNILQRA